MVNSPGFGEYGQMSVRCRSGSFLLLIAVFESACGPGKPETDGETTAVSTSEQSPTTAFEPTSVSSVSSPEESTSGSSAASTGSFTSAGPDPGGAETGSTGSMMGTLTVPDPDTTDPDPSTGSEEFTCESYCAVFLGSCNVDEYDDEADCLGQCAQWPNGPPGATTGDSLQCRGQQASMASMSDVMHCSFAGPSGGGVCVDPNAPTCGDYCAVYFANCEGLLNLYLDVEDCLVQCADWYPGSVSDTSGDTVGCRTYHAGASRGDDVTHCPHAGPDGASVCVVF